MTYTKISREEFLLKRAADVADARRIKRENPSLSMVIVEPGDEIICDSCNADVEEKIIHLDDYGVKCVVCRGESEGA